MLPSPAALSARRLRKTLSPLVIDAVKRSDADRYRKHFPAFAHVWMLLLHTMSANESLRQSHAHQQADASLRARLGMPEWISYSQLARSSASRPSACFENLLEGVRRKALNTPLVVSDAPLGSLGTKLAVLDSTFFSLSRKVCPWSEHKGYAPGVRLQTELDLCRTIPTNLGLTLSKVSDRTALKEWDLSSLGGWTLIFDLGYYAHAHFERLLGEGVSFVTRLQSQARYEVLASEPSSPGQRTPEGDTVLSEEKITLGSPNNRTGAVLENMRLVTSETRKGELHRLITDRHDLLASEVVVRLYRKRWQIELFFRWLKRQLGALRVLGVSREAVWLTILLAAIVAVVVMLVEAARPKGVTRVSWLRALWCALFSQLRLSG
ncbi:MAG: IS4 family transposase [Actinomycetota bacterium]|nr:IS4 family transposase [Actinomycetota bacterium]